MSIPDKRYFTIGEVSALCALKPHVLRYWEQEFNVLKPSKRRGNRRYYRREDVFMIQQIKHLLYDRGFTISGARAELLGGGEKPTETVAVAIESQSEIKQLNFSFSMEERAAFRHLLEEVREILS